MVTFCPVFHLAEIASKPVPRSCQDLHQHALDAFPFNRLAIFHSIPSSIFNRRHSNSCTSRRKRQRCRPYSLDVLALPILTRRNFHREHKPHLLSLPMIASVLAERMQIETHHHLFPDVRARMACSRQQKHERLPESSKPLPM